MRYTFFEIENFRGIRKTRLDLALDGSSARIFTLVGLNESGKTTVLEAIDQFQGTDDNEPSPKELGEWEAPDAHTFIPIAERTNFNGKVIIRCGVELEDSDVEILRELLKQSDGYKLTDLNRTLIIADEYFFQDSKFVKRRSLWTGLEGTGTTKQGRAQKSINHKSDPERWEELTQHVRTRLPKIWYFPDFLFDFPDRIYLDASDDESVENRFYRTLFQDILNALDRNLSTDKHVLERYRSGKNSDKDNLKQVLLETGRHVSESVVSSWNEIFRDKPMSQKRVQIDIDEDASNTINNPDGTTTPGIYVSFSIEDVEGFFSVHERSRGFRWFFVYLLITTYRGARKGSSKDILFLFDEPASNLHSTAQAALLSSFSKLSEKALVIYATHSHHLIQPAWLGTTYVVANRAIDPRDVSPDVSANRSDIRVMPYRQFASSHPDQRHYFQPILDVLDYAPSQLELVPEAVMVEGKSDYYLLRYFQEVIAKTPKKSKLSFLPGGGSGTLDDIIQLYLAWSRPFVALLDNDKSGNIQLNRYVEKFGEIIKPHLTDLSRVTNRKGVKAIESMLSDKEKIAFQQLVDPKSNKYKKKLLALAVQEALAREIPMEFSKSTRQVFERALENLRSTLDNLK